MAKISTERKVTYYIGTGMMVLGGILFISVFFSVFNSMNSFGNNFMSPGFFNEPKMPNFLNPIIGMVLMIVGGFVRNIGARGAAGSGLILDPEQAREDLKPFSEAAGGIVNDAINQVDAVKEFTKAREEKEVIKIKCRNCGSLNDEDAKFCKSCGKEV